MINFKKIKVVLENEILETSLYVENNIIKSIGKTSNKEGYDLPSYYLIPGLIDQHMHGAMGKDTMDLEPDAVKIIARGVLKEGTTSFIPTTMTQTFENIEKAINNVYNSKNYKDGANILGVHMEGPFISKVFKGAQKEDCIQDISISKMQKWNKDKMVRIISVAPELDNSVELLKYCQENNILFSIGHTNCTFEEAKKLIDLGAKNYTHGFNAMSKLHHRDIGCVGAFLYQDNAKVELICDKIHVSPAAVQLLYKLKGLDNIILITDSMRQKGLGDGESELGGQKVIVKNGEARLTDGTLAGSVLKLIDGVKNFKEINNLKLNEAIIPATKNPAINLGIYDKKGSIDLNKDADLVVLDEKLNVVMTIVGGKILYDKNQEI